MFAKDGDPGTQAKRGSAANVRGGIFVINAFRSGHGESAGNPVLRIKRCDPLLFDTVFYATVDDQILSGGVIRQTVSP